MLNVGHTVIPQSRETKKEPRPNILWIYLEDVSGWFGTYGDDVIKTPHIDKLAKRGIRYHRFYTTAPVCSASRSAIITGMMQTTIGAHHHRSSRSKFRNQTLDQYDQNILPDQVIPLPIRLKQAGYWTFNEGGKDDYNFEWNTKAFYDFFKRPWGPDSFVSGEVLKHNTENKPFFGQIQLKGGKHRDIPKMVDRLQVPVPPYYPDIPEIREEIGHHYDCLIETDRQVGEIMKALKKKGLHENTFVFLFSDHGMRLHRHKQFLYDGGIRMPLMLSGPGIKANQTSDDLISGIDIAATTLALAGMEVPKEMEGQTIIGKDYKKRDYVVAARDRCDFTIDRIRSVITPQFKYIKNYLTDRPYLQPSYKDGWSVSKKLRKMKAEGLLNESQFAFFGSLRPEEELYDIINDPHEIHNLANDTAYLGEVIRHRNYLAEWIDQTEDKGQQIESNLGLKATLQIWGKKCINPEYDLVR
ncbi:MAG: sulfatase [Flavobacteriaceae bacterium]|nr:sulfatase [Flavobacteriaceae bacterium]MCY4267237.1 sulfatase [Flavobacteriaceae bacterium]